LQTLDKNQLINLQHHIGLYAHDIEGALISFKRKIKDKKEISQNEILQLIDRITLSNKKILAINKLATKAKFLTDSEEIKVDLVNFVNEYINNILMFEDNKKIHLNLNCKNIEFITIFSPFEFTIVLDNILQNAKKVNKPKKIIVNIECTKDKDKFQIIIYDNGKGLDKSIDNPDEIFTQGFTTTDGSGLGLFHVRQILQKYGFSIYVDSTYKEGFKLIIEKEFMEIGV
jgi:signal transduction histidine kinase